MVITPTQTFARRNFTVSSGKFKGAPASKMLILTVNKDPNGNVISEAFAVQKYDSVGMPIGRRYFADFFTADKYFNKDNI